GWPAAGRHFAAHCHGGHCEARGNASRGGRTRWHGGQHLPGAHRPNAPAARPGGTRPHFHSGHRGALTAKLADALSYLFSSLAPGPTCRQHPRRPSPNRHAGGPGLGQKQRQRRDFPQELGGEP
nr:hypothetical protein [Tanacetum cinerariifolium]